VPILVSVIRPVTTPFDRPIRLGVFISGGGTTLGNFIDKIATGELFAEIPIVLASNESCAGIDRARRAGLPCEVVRRADFLNRDAFSDRLFTCCREAEIDLVALAGFLCRLRLPHDFQYRVMNIHPALIPSFCGKGFHGPKVHQAALERGVKVSGCTVHFVDDEYDHGPIILQRPVPVLDDDTPEGLASRVFQAECDAYPEAIRLYAAGRIAIENGRTRILNGG